MPEHICVKYCFKILLCEYNRCSKQLSVMPWGEQTFEWLPPNAGIIQVNAESIQFVLLNGAHREKQLAKGCNIMGEQQPAILEIAGRLSLLHGTHQ